MPLRVRCQRRLFTYTFDWSLSGRRGRFKTLAGAQPESGVCMNCSARWGITHGLFILGGRGLLELERSLNEFSALW